MSRTAETHHEGNPEPTDKDQPFVGVDIGIRENLRGVGNGAGDDML